MSLTNGASVYAALNEMAINRLVQIALQERPSWFNYATAGVIASPKLLCQALTINPEVTKRQNPIFTEVSPLPLLGTNGMYGLDFAFQLTAIQLDVSPGNSITLPSPPGPLPAQRLAAHVGLAGGVACPSADAIRQLPPVTDPKWDFGDLNVKTVIPTTALTCFNVDAYLVLSAQVAGAPPNEVVTVDFDGFKLTGLVAPGVEAVVECYVNTLLEVAVVPRLKSIVPTMLQYPLPSIPNITLPLALDLTWAPTTSSLPLNPALSNDEIQVYLDAKAVTIAATSSGGSSGSGGNSSSGGGGTGSGGSGGPIELTLAVAQATISQIFAEVIKNFKAEKSDPNAATLGPITLGYDIAFHFRNDTEVQPTLELQDDGSILLHDLKILWDKLELTVGVNLPTIEIGGFCILPNPFGGCLVQVPGVTLFGADPDFSFTLALDQIVTSEVSVDAKFAVDLVTNPNRLPTDSDWDAHDNHRANYWQLSIATPVVHVDPLDVGDIVGDLFKNAVQKGIDDLLNSLGIPQVIISIVDDILGGIDNIIRAVLNLPDDLVQWLEQQLNGPVGLTDTIATLVSSFLLGQAAIPITENPLPVDDETSAKPSLIAIMVPIDSLQARVTAPEIILEGSIG